MRTTDKYVFFWSGTYSNWHPSAFQVDNVWYNCAEQYLMAAKARLFGDTTMESRIMSAVDPADQKRYGRMVQGFDADKWNAAAKDVMYKALYAKFTQNEDLKKEMLSHGTRTFVEASPKDRIWGIGMHWKDRECDDPKNWKGTNWLGESLTKVRDDIGIQGVMTP